MGMLRDVPAEVARVTTFAEAPILKNGMMFTRTRTPTPATEQKPLPEMTIKSWEAPRDWAKGDFAMLMHTHAGKDVLVVITDEVVDGFGLISIMIAETRCECGAKPEEVRRLTREETAILRWPKK